MAFERMGERALDYMPCRYPQSRLRFRGPERRLEGRFAAFLGGTDTFGKFIEQPFPALVEARTGVKCVNFGWPNAGVDVFLNDPGVLAAANRAAVTVLQVPCVQNMSNRYYSVHPRRNDRFLQASATLRAIYGEVDFTEFHFVRHMLTHLQRIDASRFDMVRLEMQTAWVARMQLLIDRIGGAVVLLWMSARDPDQQVAGAETCADPNFVSRRMIEALRPRLHEVVEVTAGAAARAEGTKGMRFDGTEAPAAREVLGPTVHYQAADALADIVAGFSPPSEVETDTERPAGGGPLA